MGKSARSVTRVTVLAAVVVAAGFLVMSGVNVAGKHKRVEELSTMLQTSRARMKDLYDRRAVMIQGWLDEQAARPAAEGKRQANLAAAAAAAQAGSTVTTASAEEAARAEEALAAVRAALEDSRQARLESQDDFDRFDRLQIEISNYVAGTLLEQLRHDVASEQGSPALADQVRDFETLEMEIANTRRDYHEAAFERNALVGSLASVPLIETKAPAPVPVFATESILHRQTDPLSPASR